MNILEAIKSGRNFFRKSWSSREPIDFSCIGKLSKEAFLAEDWEVEEVSATISEKDFWVAVHKSRIGMDQGKALAKELGLLRGSSDDQNVDP